MKQIIGAFVDKCSCFYEDIHVSNAKEIVSSQLLSVFRTTYFVQGINNALCFCFFFLIVAVSIAGSKRDRSHLQWESVWEFTDNRTSLFYGGNGDTRNSRLKAGIRDAHFAFHPLREQALAGLSFRSATHGNVRVIEMHDAYQVCLRNRTAKQLKMQELYLL